MARVFRSATVVDGELKTCACPTCSGSEPKAAKGEAPAPPDMAAVIRKEQAAPAPAPVDRSKAPASIDFVDFIQQQQKGGK